MNNNIHSNTENDSNNSFINLQKEDPIQRILGGDEFLSKRETNK